jgi:hypothetical protein
MNEIIEQKTGLVSKTGRMEISDIISHVAGVQEVMRAIMKEDTHYGKIPGTTQPTLFKQGAEVLCMAFRVADSYKVEDLSTNNSVRYRVTCTGQHQVTGVILGSGMGEASSSEEKYKWRKAFEDEYNSTPENLRREKKGYNKQEKKNYSTYQVRTEPADLANTILKMANKRAKIAMTINVTACGDMFIQDLEDMDDALRDHLTRYGKDAETGEVPPPPLSKPALPAHTAESMAEAMPSWCKVIESGRKTHDQVLATVRTIATLTADQEAEIRAIKAPAAPVTEPKHGATDAQAKPVAIPVQSAD